MGGSSEPAADRGELWLLSYYAASELSGGMLFGKMARWTSDPELRSRLIWHCAEETRHAWLWTETIQELGGEPEPVIETYQSRYLMEVGLPSIELELLAITRVFEARVAAHFAAHLRRPAVHPRVAETLSQMLRDERSHLQWVDERLRRWSDDGRDAEVAETLRRYRSIDRTVYRRELEQLDSRGPALASFAAQLRAGLESEPDA